MRGKGNLIHCWWDCKLVKSQWKAVRNTLKKVKINLLFHLYHFLACAKWTQHHSTDICSVMFIAALFTTAREWRQTKWPSTNEWIMKTLYIYITVYYEAIEKTEIQKVAHKWIKLEQTIPSEITQTLKHKHCVFSLMWGS